MARANFGSESELCASLSAEAARLGWTVFPEFAGYDLLLAADGIQIGVEAKLKPSMAVLAQVAGRIDASERNRRGPAYFAVATGADNANLRMLCRRLGVAFFVPSRRGWSELSFDWYPLGVPAAWENSAWDLEHVLEPLDLPGAPMDLAAGIPSPKRDTQWKRRALRLIARLQVNGKVTSADFRDIEINCQRWIAMGWLKRQSRGVFVANALPPFATDSPELYAKILAEESKA